MIVVGGHDTSLEYQVLDGAAAYRSFGEGTVCVPKVQGWTHRTTSVRHRQSGSGVERQPAGAEVVPVTGAGGRKALALTSVERFKR